MPTLLVQSCSKSKNTGRSPGPAFDIYDGYYFKILKKAIDEGEFDHGLEICILSAKYGLLDRSETIETYDQEMDTDRAGQLRESVTANIRKRVETGNHDQVVVNAGKAYREAIDPDSIPVPVHEIGGEGLGEKGHNLKRYVRGERAVLTGDT